MNANQRRGGWQLALPLLALWSFAVAQPLYDLLAANPTYLTAHELIGTSLFVFIGVLSIGLPLMLIFPVLLPGQIQSFLVTPIRMWTKVLAVALLIALFSGMLRRLALDIGVWLELLLTGGLSALLVWRFGNSALALEYLRFASVAAVLFPTLFLWQLPKSYLGNPLDSSPAEISPARAPLPAREQLPDIVLIVFDELALTTLINPVTNKASGPAAEDYLIDASRYPNFSAFGGDATWYRQASAVAAGTRLAVPAIFTGEAPDKEKSPDSAAHPDNIFSRLIGSYALNVEEPITRLCSYRECQRKTGLWLTVKDTVAVLGHVAGPTWLVNRLPPIGGHWVGFWSAGSAEAGHVDERVESINRFVRGLEETATPGLHVLHSVLPHVPYTLLPQGQRLFRHAETEARSPGHVIDQQGDRFVNAPWSVNESEHFYQWQLGYVDLALGRIVQQLKALDKYDEALVIVTADHGLRFAPGKSRREPEPQSFVDIAAIPLLVKLPGQTGGRIEDRAIASTEIRHIIERALQDGAEPQARARNVDLPNKPGWPRAILSSSGLVDLPERFDFSTRQNLPPTLKRGFVLSGEALGEIPPACANTPDTPNFSLAEEGVYQNTHPEHFLAAHVLFEATGASEASDLVALVNHVPAAVYQTGPLQYSAFIPPELLKPGYNSVHLLKGRGDSACTLYTLPKL